MVHISPEEVLSNIWLISVEFRSSYVALGVTPMGRRSGVGVWYWLKIRMSLEIKLQLIKLFITKYARNFENFQETAKFPTQSHAPINR